MSQAFNLSQFANKVNSSGQADLTTAVTGTLPQGNGGTGLTTPGTSGNVLMSNGTNWVSGTIYPMRNRIINGAMVIDQRNNGASATPVNQQYLVDRWKYGSTQSGKLNYQQNYGSVTPPAGFSYYSGFISNSAYTPLTGDVFTFTQYIEGYNISDLAWGTANAKTITLSFWVRSSLTGTFGGALGNVDATRSYPFTYTISSANTWEQKTITIAGDTTGTWNTTNSIGLAIYLSLGVGTTYAGTAGSWVSAEKYAVTSQVNVVGTNGATWYITGVQLEQGSTATPFETRMITNEFALCQRYYQYCNNGSIQIAMSADTAYSVLTATMSYPPMRVDPTISISSCTLIGHFGGVNPATVFSSKGYGFFQYTGTYYRNGGRLAIVYDQNAEL